MANTTRKFWLSDASGQINRTDIQYALDGSAFSSVGITASTTRPGWYWVELTFDTSLDSSITWRLPTGNPSRPYDYASEDFHPNSASGSNSDKTGYKLAPDGLDAILVEAASTDEGISFNARQTLSMLLARAWGAWSQDPTGRAEFSAAGNPDVLRGTFQATDDGIATNPIPPE